jgi:hypothetical protein
VIRRSSIALLFFCLALGATSIVSAQGSVANYAVTRTTGITYQSIAATGTSVTSWRNTAGGTLQDDNRSFPQPIGFDFWYNGTSHTTFSVSTNGFIDFSSNTANGTGTNAFGYANAAFSGTTAAAGTWLTLAPIYDDLTTQGATDPLGNGVKYQVSGTAPYRVLTVEWINLAVFGNTSPSLNFQVKLYESTGIIEFVYGTMTVGTGWTPSYSSGINDSVTAAILAADLLTQQTANTATFSNTVQNNLATVPQTNSRIRFSPPVPRRPSNLTISGITGSSMQLNWTDVATNEVRYAIFRSTDGVEYDLVSQLTPNSATTTATGLLGSTLYYWRVIPVTEGNVDSAAAASDTTLQPSTFVSQQSGLWSSTSTWLGGVVPTTNANVIIDSSHAVTLDASPTVNTLTVGQGSRATLLFGNNATARTLTLVGDLIVSDSARFVANAASLTSSHLVTTSGNILNNGTLDFEPSGTSRVQAQFTKAGSQTISGSGDTTRFYLVVLSMGASSSNTLDVFSTDFRTGGSGFLTIQNGTFKFASPRSITPFTTATTVPLSGGLWVANPSAVVSTTGGSLTVQGLIRVTSGRLVIGSAADHSLISNGATVTVEGGTLAIAGRFDRFNVAATTRLSMSGGELRVPTIGSTSTTNAPFMMDVVGSQFDWSGGRIIIEREGGTGANDLGYVNTGSSTWSVVGGTLQIGSSSTPAVQTMSINTNIPVFDLVDSSANATARLLTNPLTVRNDVLIAAGTLNANNLNMTVKRNWTNAGTFTPGTATVTFDSTLAQTITDATGETFNNLTINKPSGTITQSGHVTVTGTMSVTSGIYNVGSDTLTLNGAFTLSDSLLATSGTVGYQQAGAGQAVRAAVYRDLVFAGGTKVLPATGAVEVKGTFAPGAASGHTITGSTIAFTGASQSIPAFRFNNLSVTGTAPTLAATDTVTGALNVGGSTTLNLGANNLVVNGNATNAGSITGTGQVVLAGGSSPHALGGTGTYVRLTLNDAQGAVASDDVTVSGQLTLTSGVFSSTADTVIIGASGSVSRTTGHVNGYLRKTVPTGTDVPVYFELGDATRFAPDSVVFSSVSQGGTLTSRSVGAEHPQIATSPLNLTDNVNRYWQFYNDGVLYSTHATTFRWDAADQDQAGNELGFATARYDGAAWDTTASSNHTATSLRSDGNTIFAEYAVGGTTPTNAYRTRASGNWNGTTVWQYYHGPSGTWRDTTAFPTSTAGLISIRSPHVIAVSAGVTVDQVLIESGGQVTVNAGQTLTIANGGGTDLTVLGTLRIVGNDLTINAGATIAFGAGGLYQHAKHGGNIPVATWDPASTVEIVGGAAAGATLPGNRNQVFGNFTWNYTTQNAALALALQPATITGTYRVVSSGSSNVRLLNNTTTALTIGGDLVIQGGTVLGKNAGNNTQPINVAGGYQQSGGTFTISDGAADNVNLTVSGGFTKSAGTLTISTQAATDNLNIAGNFSHTGGTITETSTGTANIVFNGTGTQTHTSGGTVSNQINFSVSSGATLDMGTSVITGGGTFTLANGGTLIIGSTDGITATGGGAVGNIQVTGTRTFNTGANYVYRNAIAAQVTGSGLPATVNKLTINNGSVGGVSLTANTAVTDSLILTAGPLTLPAGRTLTITNVVAVGAGSLSSDATATVEYNRGSAGQSVLSLAYGNLTFSNFAKILPSGVMTISGAFTPGSGTGHAITGNTVEFNGAAQSIPAFTYNKLRVSGSGLKTATGNLSVADSLIAVSSDTLRDGGFTLTSKGNILLNVPHGGTGRILITGTTSTPTIAGSASFANLELDNLTYGASLNGGMTVRGTLTLTKGILQTGSDTLFMAPGALVSRPVGGGHVRGFLSKIVPVNASPQNVTFEVGDAASYAPVSLNFTSVSVQGRVAARTLGVQHPDAVNSGLDSSKGTNRYWTLVNNGVVFSTFSSTLTFVSGDIDAGANPAFFFVRRKSGSVWSAATNNTRASFSTTGSPWTGFGDFVTGELNAIVYWTGAAGTANWGDALNWSSLSLPTAGNDVYFTTTDTVLVNVAAIARKFVMEHDSVLFRMVDSTLTLSDSLVIRGGEFRTERDSLPYAPFYGLTGGVVHYARTSGTQYVRNTPHFDIRFSGAGSKVISSAFTADRNMTIDAGAPVTVADAGVQVGGNFTNNGSLTAGTGTYTFSGSGVTLGGSSITTLANATVTGSATQTARLTVTGSVSGAGSLTNGTNATLRVAGGVTVGTFTATAAGNTVEYNGAAQAVRATAYDRLLLSTGGTKTAGGSFAVQDSLEIASTVTFADGGFTITAQASVVNAGTHSGSGSIRLSSGVVAHPVSGAGTFSNLELNDANGATLAGSVTTISGTLTLTNGLLTIPGASDTLSIGSGGSIVRASGHVVGTLRRYVASGGSSILYPVGTAIGYQPVRLQFASVTTPGFVSVSRRPNEHPNIGDPTSVADSTKNVNAWWRLVPNGIVLGGNFTATFAFANPAELDAGVSPTSSNFIGHRWSGSAWSLPTVGDRSADSTRLDGLTAFGDFVLADLLAATITVTTSGGWASPATWPGGRIPGALDTVVIPSPFTITLDTNATLAQLVIQTGGTFNGGTDTLTLTGNLTLDGTWSGGGLIVMTTPVDTIRGTGSTSGTATLLIDATSVVHPTADLTLYAVTVANGDTLRNLGSVTVTTLDGAGVGAVFVNGATATLTITGSVMSTGTLDASASPNSVIYDSPNSQTIIAAQYHNLTISGARTVNTVTLETGTIGVAGAFTPSATYTSGSYLAAGDTLAFNGTGAQFIPAFQYGTLRLDNNRTINNITFDPDGTIAIGEAFIPSASFSSGDYVTTSSNIRFNGAGAQSIPTFAYENLEVDGGGVKTLAASTTVGDSLAVLAATLDLGTLTANRATSGGALVVASGATLRVGGSAGGEPGSNFPTNYASVQLNGAVDYNGTGAQTVAPLHYHDLVLSGTRGTNNVTLPADTVFVAGAFTASAAFTSGSYVTTNNTFAYDGSATQTVAAPFAYYNLTFAGNRGAGTVTLAADTVRVANIFDPLATFTTGGYSVASNTFDFDGTGAQTVPAFQYFNLRISGNRGANSVTLAGSDTVHVAGTFAPLASFAGGSYVTTGSSFDYNAAGAQAVAAFDYRSLTLSGSGVKTLAAGTTRIAADLTLAGSASVNAVANSTTIEYNGSATQSVAGVAYYALTFNNSGVKTLSASASTASTTTIAAASTFRITAAGSMLFGADIENDGIFQNEGTITVP